VRCYPLDTRSVRWKSAGIYFAGPGIELLLAVLILLGVGSETLLTRTSDVGIIALQSVALAAVTGAVVNLIPHSTMGPAGEMLNDGLGILWSLGRPVHEWEAEIRARRFLESENGEIAEESTRAP
jgi:hypothetical protein